MYFLQQKTTKLGNYGRKTQRGNNRVKCESEFAGKIRKK